MKTNNQLHARRDTGSEMSAKESLRKAMKL